MRYVVGLSGGKDSTAMSLELKRLYPNRQFDYVCTPTGDELPDMQKHFENLEILLGGKLIRLPTTTLSQLIDHFQALPNHMMRWCTRIIKLEPMIDYMNNLPKDSILYVGLRADEEGRIGLETGVDDSFKVVYPMREWGWDLNMVQTYLKCRGVKIPRRTDCARCFFQSLEDWRQLWLRWPEIYQSAIDDEERIGHTFRGPNKDKNWPHELKNLRKEFEMGRKPRIVKRKKGRKCRLCSL